MLVWRLLVMIMSPSFARRAQRPRAHAAAPGEKFAAPSPVVRTGHFELTSRRRIASFDTPPAGRVMSFAP
ncbi:hypothetical protein KCP75_24465 [Salmonella enterica subsp. enterica]|nr:hypothetical protein KCP75_24465 [Salmonella enterica subsp. enterica]